MANIIQTFRIRILPDETIFMYCELDDGRYTKTYKTNDLIQSEFISLQEYASALASMILSTEVIITRVKQ